jgi:hypothetical protein
VKYTSQKPKLEFLYYEKPKCRSSLLIGIPEETELTVIRESKSNRDALCQFSSLAELFENARQVVKDYSAVATSDKINRRGLELCYPS